MNCMDKLNYLPEKYLYTFMVIDLWVLTIIIVIRASSVRGASD